MVFTYRPLGVDLISARNFIKFNQARTKPNSAQIASKVAQNTATSHPALFCTEGWAEPICCQMAENVNVGETVLGLFEENLPTKKPRLFENRAGPSEISTQQQKLL